MVTLAARLSSDLDAIFNPSHLAVSATITKSDSSTITINVHFERDWVNAETAVWGTNVAGEQLVDQEIPAMHCKTSDLVGVVKGNTVLVDGQTFRIRDIQNNGTGVSLVYLW